MLDRQLLVHKQRMTTLRDRQPARTSAIIILPMTLSHLAWDDGDIGPRKRVRIAWRRLPSFQGIRPLPVRQCTETAYSDIMLKEGMLRLGTGVRMKPFMGGLHRVG